MVRAQSNREISSNIAQLLSAGKQQPLCSRFSLPLSHWINKTWLFLPDWHPHPPVHHPPLKRFSKTFYSPPVLRQCINILLYISTGSSAVSFSRGRLVDNLQLGCFITVAITRWKYWAESSSASWQRTPDSQFFLFSPFQFNLTGYHTGTTISLISRQSHFLSTHMIRCNTRNHDTHYRPFPTYWNRSSNWLPYIFSRSKPIIHFLTSLHHAVFLETRTRRKHLIGKSYRNRYTFKFKPR